MCVRSGTLVGSCKSPHLSVSATFLPMADGIWNAQASVQTLVSEDTRHKCLVPCLRIPSAPFPLSGDFEDADLRHSARKGQGMGDILNQSYLLKIQNFLNICIQNLYDL